ncbi:unnamed protein product [Phaedon cochleariae]|uniref:CRAL-TRIO domain-containing protein n=1 Tax=Phaedon cochleariae TaxID=80249 RepID=A0A9N9WYA7_PHACE|nr:unnamed protein product [Phaedon cochleariae]
MKLEYKFTSEDIIAEGRVTREDIEIIRTWLSNLKDDYVPENVQDETIVLILLSCTNDIELTKKTIQCYYKLKKNGPEIYDDRNLKRPDIQVALNTIHMSSIPVRTEQNDVVHFFKVHDTNYNNFDLVPIMKISYMLMDISQEKNPPNGIIVVIDMKGLGLMHMTKMKIGAIKKYLTFLQEGFPMKMKEIHILNTVHFIDKLMSLIKVFMKSELMSMLHFHPANMEQETFFEWVPKKCLPKEYGGDLPSERDLHDVTMEQFKARQEFWNAEEQIRKQKFQS